MATNDESPTKDTDNPPEHKRGEAERKNRRKQQFDKGTEIRK